MSIRIAAFVLVPAVLGAGAFALYDVEHGPTATASTPHAMAAPLAATDDELPTESGEALPPNHPPIGGGMSAHGSAPTAAADAPAITWTMPAGWQDAPSPNAMRLATYRAPGGVEVSVSRAGGAAEANIQRWNEQFDDVGREDRVEKKVRGLQVITVEFDGTYVGGGMTGGAAASPKRDWAMVGAIIETASPSYFFKMTGPAAAIHAARPAFDRFVGGVAPVTPM